jgi:hypothetical protein
MLNLFIAVVQSQFRDVKNTSGFEWLNPREAEEEKENQEEEKPLVE